MSLRSFNLWIVNHLPLLRFYGYKRRLLNRIKGVHLGEGTRVVGHINLTSCSLTTGKNCFINRDVVLLGNGSVTLGDNVELAPEVHFLTGGHHIGPSDHRAGEGFVGSVNVGTGTWIGAKAMLIDKNGSGLVIESGDVIAAGSVVIANTEKDALYAGVPAQKKKSLD
jgi:maltose O-acetyltransferase